MANILLKVINREGISKTELSRACTVSVTTIGKVCNNEIEVKEVTKGKIIKGLNLLIGSDKYSIEQIFN